MGYSNELYEQAMEIIAERRKDAENKLLARMEFLAGIDPEYAKCNRDMISSAQDVLSTLSMEPEEAEKKLIELRQINLDTQAKLGGILKKHKLPDDYFEVKYSCPICEDTGTVGTKLCSCMIETLKKLTIDEEGKKSPLKFSRFEDFRLDYYSDSKNVADGETAREHMRKILDFCRAYAAGFDRDSVSVFMYGETGLGKTHLSLAIAAEVIEKGFSVVYNSAQNILNRLNRIQFGKEDDETFEPMLLGCDLLVIDDLGAEFQTAFTQAAVYNIINTRMNSGLPTIISTNIGLEDIAANYTKRISSRIIGEYAVLRFLGEDVRQIKKNED